MTIPAQLQPHWHSIQTIDSESGVPASRIGGTVLIESNGNPTAVQKNTSNGWSYGLMQVVPYGVGWEGWHELIRTTAGLPTSASREQIISALYDPVTNLRVGAKILADLKRYHGTWDRASSVFFLGNPDWRGQDTVNGNTGAWYRDTLNKHIAALDAEPGGDATMVRFAGSNVDVPLDMPFRIDLIPVGQTNQRPGIRMTPEKFVVHETDNFQAGANAEMHRRYFKNGAEGRQASVHLIVDADELIQILPFNEVGWHGGDGGGTCNYGGVAMEVCVNDNNVRKSETRANAERATAAALRAIGSSVLQQHSKCCSDVGNPGGCHSLCPRTIRDEGYWPTYVSHVNAMLAGTSPAPIVVYPPAVLVPVFDGTDKKLGKTTALAVQRQFVATRDGVKVHMFADPKSAEIRAPLKKGEAVTSWYVAPGADGKDWVITAFSARIPMDGLSPTVSVT